MTPNAALNTKCTQTQFFLLKTFESTKQPDFMFKFKNIFSHVEITKRTTIRNLLATGIFIGKCVLRKVNTHEQ